MPPAKPEPGRDPEMARRTQALSVLFAFSSVALLVTVAAMIYVDYDREWKHHQRAFNALDIQHTQEEIEAALGKVDASKRQAVEAQLEKGRQEVAAQQAEISKLESEVDGLEGEWYAADQDFRFTKARIDVYKYELEEALHKGKPGTAERKTLADAEAKLRANRQVLEEVTATRDGAKAQLAEKRKTLAEAERIQKELYLGKTRLDEKLKKIQPGFVSVVRNLPILDLANPSEKVQQIMPAHLKDDVIFTGTEKVDRCTTCHLAIDRKGFEKADQPFRTHPNVELYLQGSHPIDKVGCTVCHQGRGRATSFVNAAHTPSDTEQEAAWGKYSGSKTYHGLHYWDFPMTTRAYTESQCAKCHKGVVEVPDAPRLNAGVRLVEKYGCYGCHKIKGWENLRKVGPDLTKITSKTKEDWIFRWIKEPKAFRLTRMPQVWGVRPDETKEQLARNDVEANAAVAYLVTRSKTETYPAPPAGNLEAGKKTFETVGCLACHRIGDDSRGMEKVKNAAGKDVVLPAANFRTHGPNLDGSGSKLDAGWLYAWIRDPKSYWHDTRMPNLRLTEREAADVTAYLMSLKNDEFMGRPRPALDAALRDAIVKESLQGLLPVKQAEARLASMSDEERTLYLGEKTIGRYGCFGCHTIEGFEKASPIGVELTEQGSKLVDRLDFGFQHGKIAHTLPAWLKLKVMDPRIYDEGKQETKKPEEWLRMPKFWLNEDEADAVVTAVLSFSKEAVPLAAQRQLSADERYVEQGRRLVRDYNCQGCHVVGSGGSIGAVIKANLVAAGGDDLQAPALSPPMLYNAKSRIGEGARVHTPWLHGFLKDPSKTIRPWLEVRMPTFDFTEEQLNAITHYFAAQDGVTYPYAPIPQADAATVAAGRDLFTKWQCAKCHVVAGKLPAGQEPANMAPDLAMVPERLRPEWLSIWLANPGRVMPGTRMPSNFPAKPSENAYPEILGGDQQKQIEAVRAYLLTLGRGGAAAASR